MIGDSWLFDSRPRRGFTLVELLVVIGIIVLLTGILLPMVVKAMRSAQRTRIGADLGTIGVALEAYKNDFGDYPRIIYTGDPVYNGTGSGAAVLGKALLGLGDASYTPSNTYSNTATYVAGQIVTTGTAGLPDFEATQAVPAGNTPAYGSAYWAPIACGSSLDGANGPGFSIRAGGGHVYGPYLQIDKFKTLGLAIVDSYGNPILYYPANPGKPVVTSNTGAGGIGSSLVGTAAGVSTPNISVSSPTGPCLALYNYSDNDTGALNGSTSTSPPAFIPAFPSIDVMYAMLGDYKMQGYISTGETAATTANYLLWSAGPDGLYGPVNANSVGYFQGLDPTSVKKLVGKCDDVTNFTFAQ